MINSPHNRNYLDIFVPTKIPKEVNLLSLFDNEGENSSLMEDSNNIHINKVSGEKDLNKLSNNNCHDINQIVLKNPDSINYSRNGCPVLIYVTGGAWIIGYKAWGALLGLSLRRHDVCVVSVDYRNFPQGSIEDMVIDIEQACRWVWENIHDYGGDRNQLFLCGQSAGAHITSLMLVRNAKKEAEGAFEEEFIEEEEEEIPLINDDETKGLDNINNPSEEKREDEENQQTLANQFPHSQQSQSFLDIKNKSKRLDEICRDGEVNYAKVRDSNAIIKGKLDDISVPQSYVPLSINDSTSTKTVDLSFQKMIPMIQTEDESSLIPLSSITHPHLSNTTSHSIHPSQLKITPSLSSASIESSLSFAPGTIDTDSNLLLLSPNALSSPPTSSLACRSGFPSSRFLGYCGLSGIYSIDSFTLQHLHKQGLPAGVLCTIMGGFECLPLVSPTQLLGRSDYSSPSIISLFPPTLLLHGSADTSAPIQGCEEFATTLASYGVRVELKIYTDAGHTDPIIEDPLRGRDRLSRDLLTFIYKPESKISFNDENENIKEKTEISLSPSSFLGTLPTLSVIRYPPSPSIQLSDSIVSDIPVRLARLVNPF